MIKYYRKRMQLYCNGICHFMAGHPLPKPREARHCRTLPARSRRSAAFHDHNTVNYGYGMGNSECNVHLIRYLKANLENTHHDWSGDMIGFLLALKRSKALAQRYGLNFFEQADIEEYRKRFDEIVIAGFAVLKNTKSQFYQKEEKRLLNRLRKYRDNYLLFATDFAVPFDNNFSERDIRMIKIKTKVSGCFRSLEGAKTFAVLMSVIKTAVKQNISPHIAVRAVFRGDCLLG